MKLTPAQEMLLLQASSLALVSGDVLVRDTFQDTDNADLQDHSPDANLHGNPWVVNSPNPQINRWEVESNQAKHNGSWGQSTVVKINVECSDELLVQIALKAIDTNMAASSGPGVRIAQAGPLTTIGGIFVMVMDGGAGLALFDYSVGVLGTYVGAISVGDIIRITMSGNTITGYQNGVQRVQAATAAFAGNTSVGFGGTKQGATVWEWDDFLAKIL